MTKVASAQKELFWRQLFTKYAASGLSIREFCKQQNLATHSFYFWKREIAKRDGLDAQELPALIPARIVESLRNPQAAMTERPSIRVCLPGKIIVEIYAGDLS